MKTKRLSTKYRGLVEGKFPNAGPKPSIEGMKKQFYGLESVCVMCGDFLYRLGDSLKDADAARIYALAR